MPGLPHAAPSLRATPASRALGGRTLRGRTLRRAALRRRTLRRRALRRATLRCRTLRRPTLRSRTLRRPTLRSRTLCRPTLRCRTLRARLAPLRGTLPAAALFVAADQLHRSADGGRDGDTQCRTGDDLLRRRHPFVFVGHV